MKKKKSESGVKIFARVLCVVCDVVGCSIPTNQVCDDASFFFKMIARPHPPPPPYFLLVILYDIGFKLQYLTVRVF